MTGDPRRTSALDVRVVELDALGARPDRLASQVSLRVDPGSAGIDLPRTPNTWAGLEGRDYLWLGPDEWLVVSRTEPAEAAVAYLEATLAEDHRSVIDVSANRVAVELAGPDRTEVLAMGCGLDLHPRAWRRGMCAQTLLANVAVLLQERDEATRLFVRPSFAGHLVAWFARVAPNR